MNKLAAIPLVWTVAAQAGYTLTRDSTITLGLFFAGLVFTAGFAWWCRGDRDEVRNRLRRLEDWKVRHDAEIEKLKEGK